MTLQLVSDSSQIKTKTRKIMTKSGDQYQDQDQVKKQFLKIFKNKKVNFLQNQKQFQIWKKIFKNPKNLQISKKSTNIKKYPKKYKESEK